MLCFPCRALTRTRCRCLRQNVKIEQLKCFDAAGLKNAVRWLDLSNKRHARRGSSTVFSLFTLLVLPGNQTHVDAQQIWPGNGPLFGRHEGPLRCVRDTPPNPSALSLDNAVP